MSKQNKSKKILIGIGIVWGILVIIGAFSREDTFTTQHTANTVSGKLVYTSWSDLRFEKSVAGNNYSTKWTGEKPERSISILGQGTNLISVSTFVSGDIFNPQAVYNEIGNSFQVFATIFPDDAESIKLLNENLNSYIETMFKSANHEGNFTVFDSVSDTIGNISLTTGATVETFGASTNGSFYVSLNKYLTRETID